MKERWSQLTGPSWWTCRARTCKSWNEPKRRRYEALLPSCGDCGATMYRLREKKEGARLEAFRQEDRRPLTEDAYARALADGVASYDRERADERARLRALLVAAFLAGIADLMGADEYESPEAYADAVISRLSGGAAPESAWQKGEPPRDRAFLARTAGAVALGRWSDAASCWVLTWDGLADHMPDEWPGYEWAEVPP